MLADFECVGIKTSTMSQKIKEEKQLALADFRSQRLRNLYVPHLPQAAWGLAVAGVV